MRNQIACNSCIAAKKNQGNTESSLEEEREGDEENHGHGRRRESLFLGRERSECLACCTWICSNFLVMVMNLPPEDAIVYIAQGVGGPFKNENLSV